MINIAIVDDHKLFREGIASILSEKEGIKVVLQAENGEEFLNQLGKTSIDVALLDLEMPVLNGIQTMEVLYQNNSETRVIIVSQNKKSEVISSLMLLGAKGYLQKDASPNDLYEAILAVKHTGFYFNDLVSRAKLVELASEEQINPQFNYGEELTPREKQVLELICNEFTTQEIAARLILSPKTIENHRSRIMDKTGVRNTAGLVVFAIKHNLYYVD
ncbi:MAG: response regulator transcription factor [Schleiferiaceae bacterium]|nr:response regulator transcription factor [Schleiferiaceae bacterium]